MIVQIILDAASMWVGGFFGLLPDLPAWFTAAVGQYQNGVNSVINWVAPWGFIVPLLTFVQALTWWLGFLTFYFAVQIIRFALWVMGR